MAMFTAKQIYDLKLGEEVRCGFYICRVPGGWIFGQGNGGAAVFVPWNNEFEPKAEA